MLSMNVVNILPIEVEQRLKNGEKLNIVDVREDDEVARGKIPGARHIRLSEIPERMHEIDPNAETILVCHSGGRSYLACEFLISHGYHNVKNLMGGMLAWTGDVEVY